MTFKVNSGPAMNRRTLMSSMAAAGAMMATGARGAWAATPSRGGHVRVGVRGGSTTDSLDPGTYSHAFMRTMGFAYCNTLVEVDGNNQIRPELLESFEAEKGAATWIFRLRPGITFHDGKPLTADDIIANVNHHIRPDSTSGVKATLASIAEMKREDDLTVRFILNSGNADFPAVFTDYRMMIMPGKDGALDYNARVGTGGYILKEWEPGVRATLERNPNYWRDDRAFFDSADILSISDPTTKQNALMTGSIDIMDQVDLKTVHLMRRNKNIVVEQTKGGLHHTYAMNTTLAPFDNADVRMALKYGIDREALLQKVLRGFGSVGNDHPIAPTMRYHAADIEQRQYDPDRAKHHLKKAGLDSLDLSLSVSDGLYLGATDGVTLYSEQLAAAGINLGIDRLPNDGYWTDVWMKRPFAAAYWGTRATEDMILSAAYQSGAKWNESFWSNERFDKLLVEARTELDEGKRADLYREMQLLVRDEGGTVVPLFADNVFAMSTKIGHPDAMSGAWELDGGRSIERWWFKA
ncbi:ABC transporter substrate-binding protein [Mameliella alba]|nr:ABC transporter substrate-binding protein [Antarctobacter heliothermus]MBY6143814.1 ABC transporter substrate-binding protein [Mameliella alba]MCA0952462.1 ABC transporter substrate-binding protein [Mameliella alba]